MNIETLISTIALVPAFAALYFTYKIYKRAAGPPLPSLQLKVDLLENEMGTARYMIALLAVAVVVLAAFLIWS